MNYFNKNMRFQAMACAVLLTAGAALPGCTDAEVAQTIGAIAIIGGAVAIGANTDCQGGYKNVCHDFRDYWGNVRTECRREYDSCLYLVPKRDRDRFEMNTQAMDNEAADQASSALTYEAAEAVATPVMWGNRFGISFEAATQFVDAMKAAKAGDAAPIENLGLKKKDLEKIASQAMPSDLAVETVALNLKQDRETVRAMIGVLLLQAQNPEVRAAAAK